MNIIIHGSIAYDRIMSFPRYFKDNILPDKIHSLSVSFYIEKMQELRGGCGGNIAYTLGLLQEKPWLIAAVGKDGKEDLTCLAEKGVNIQQVERHEDIISGSCSIITDRANNQITAFYVGAMKYNTNFNFENCDPKNTIAIFAPANNLADSLKYIKACQQKKIKYIFDPGQTLADYNGKQLKDCIRGSYMFTVNDYELSQALKKTGLTENNLLERTEVLITTLGAKGSTIKTRAGKTYDIPALVQDTLKDPTGAGDAYRAGLLKGLVANLSLPQIGNIAATTASFAIETVGTQEHDFTMEEFRQRYLDHFHASCPI